MKVGLFSIGLETYWQQFDGLENRLLGYHQQIKQKLEQLGVEAVRESRASNAEIDMVLQYQGLAIPLEVKAGKKGSLRSLHQFMDRTKHPFAVRLYRGPLEITEAATIQGKKFKYYRQRIFLR